MQPSSLPIGSLPPLEEADVLLAMLAARVGMLPEAQPTWHARIRVDGITGMLRFNGVAATTSDVHAVLTGRAGRWMPASSEHRYIRGLNACLLQVEERAALGTPPDGNWLLSLWSLLARSVAIDASPTPHQGRHRENLEALSYPASPVLEGLLERFREEDCFLDAPAIYRRLHPVRQSFRIFYKLARLSPFDGHNFATAWLAASAHLRCRGYPIVVLSDVDLPLVHRTIRSTAPETFPEWETRIRDTVRAALADQTLLD